MKTNKDYNLVSKLESFFKNNDLPGQSAQQILSPNIRNPKFQSLSPDKNTQQAAVLILLNICDDTPKVIFIKRQSYNGAHSGQISFPGGKKDLSDDDLSKTAIRETVEEINICINDIKLIGQLTELYIPVSNFIVTPFLGVTSVNYELKPDITEVVEIFQVDLNYFLDDSNIRIMNFTDNNFKINAPYFDINGNNLWGATAMILSEFIEIVRKIRSIP